MISLAGVWRRGRRGAARLFYALLIIFIALTVGLYLLTGTAPGTRWLLTTAISQGGLALSFKDTQGSLLGGVRIRGLHWQGKAVDLSVARAQLRWRVLDLFRGQIHIQRLTADAVRITQRATPAVTTPPGPLPRIALPLGIRIDALRLSDVQLRLANGRDYALRRLTAQAQLHGDRLRLRRLAVTAPQGRLTLTGHATLAPPYALEFQLSGQGHLPDATPVAGRVQGRGSLAQLHLTQALTRPFPVTLKGTVRALDRQADLTLQWAHAHWPLHGTARITSPQGQLRLHGGLQDYTLALRAALRPPRPTTETPPASAATAPGGALSGAAAHTPAPTGKTSTTAPHSLPATPQGTDTATTGTPGTVTRFPPIELTLDARGDAQQLTLQHISATGLGGTLQGQGRVRWQPALDWQLSLNGDHLDPGQQWPHWPGQLAVALRAHGQADTAQLNLERLTGTLRGQPAQARLQATLHLAGAPPESAQRQTGLRLSVRQAELQALGARLRVSGTANARQGDVRFEASIAQLGALLPDAHGSLHAQGRVQGLWRWPRLDARFDGAQLQRGALGLRQFQLRIQPSTGPRSSPPGLQARLDVRGLHRGDQSITHLQVQASGTPAQAHVTLDAQTPQGDIGLSLQGGWARPYTHWQGQLQRLVLHPAKGSDWRLSTSATLAAGDGRLQLGQTCLRPASTDRGELCAALDWQAQAVNLTAHWHALPLALLNPWLPANAHLSGILNGDARLRGTAAAPDGHVNASLSAGQLRLDSSSAHAADHRFDFTVPTLAAQLHQGALSAQATATLPGQGQLKARLQAQTGRAARAREAPLEAQLQLTLPSLQPLEGLVPETRDLQGRVQAQLNLTGTRAQPRLHTTLQLTDGAVTLLAPGIRIDGVQLEAHALPDGHTLAFTAAAHSGGGQLKANGQIAGLGTTDKAGSKDSGLRLEAHVQGENFEAVHLPQIEARISPQLDIKANPATFQVRGTVTVPQARIQVRRLPPSAITVSPDVEIVGAQGTGAQGPQLDAQVNLILGDKVKLTALGLSGQLTGNLLLSQQGNTPPSADGTLRIENGTYAAYGLNLSISRGVLGFAGPVDNPGLDVVAQRQTGDVTAKLTVSGTLKSPRSQVSAIPPMPESEALSWLLTGHGLSGASQSDAALLVNAIASMHVEDEGGGLMQSLQKRTGLNEISLQSGSGTPTGSTTVANGSAPASGLQQSSLLLGKYLTPKLYLRYTTGLFERSNTLSLNYQLSRHFSVEAKSGSAQGIDLLYQTIFGSR